MVTMRDALGGMLPSLVLTGAQAAALTSDEWREIVDDFGATSSMWVQLQTLVCERPGCRVLLDFESGTVTVRE